MTSVWKGALVLLAAAVAVPLAVRGRRPARPAASSTTRQANAAAPSAPSAPRAVREIHVPRATAPLVLDGEITEPAWRSTPVTRFLRPDGKDGRPYSEVRFLWSQGGVLHVGLYASDKNIVSAATRDDGPVWRGDSFHLVFSRADVEHSFDIGPTAKGAVLTDGERRGKGAWSYAWQSGARVALDMDEGTVDDPAHADEEWVIELDVPLASIGLKPEAGQRVDFAARRCDVDVRGGPPLETPCPAIALTLVLDP